VSRFVLDAGALIALDGNDALVWQLYKSARRDRVPLVTHGGVIAQVVRSGGQARLAQAIPAFDVIALDIALGRATGYLLAASRTDDVIDAALVVICEKGDTILTSDVDDIERLVVASKKDVSIIQV
jgi:hypothetical protein